MNDTLPTIGEVQQFWDARPCNVRHSPLKIGSLEYFDQVEWRRYFVEPHIKDFAQFSQWAGKQVLEVGCGIGTDAVCFSRAGAEYVGIELSEVSAEIARSRLQLYGLDGRILVGDAENLAIHLGPESSFDLVYSFGVIHHTPSPLAVLRQIRSLISPEGELRIMLYARHSWKAAMISAGLDQPEAAFGCPIAYQYSREEAQTLVESAGFSVTDIRQAHIFPYQIERYLEYDYVREPWFDAMPSAVFKALEESLGWHLLIRAKPATLA